MHNYTQTCTMLSTELKMLNHADVFLYAGSFCVGTRGYGVPGNENDESIVCMSVLY